MNTILWTLQGLTAVTFLYSGICKSTLSIRTLVDAKGQTGVEHLTLPFVRFIGTSEIAGALGLILPWALHISPMLTPIAAVMLALVMIPAAIIHYKRREPKNIATNVILFTCCIVIAAGRW